MADKPKPGAYPPDPRTWRPPPAPSAMLAHKRHKVRATVCAQAKTGEGMTSNWDDVNCGECLRQAPFRRKR